MWWKFDIIGERVVLQTALPSSGKWGELEEFEISTMKEEFDAKGEKMISWTYKKNQGTYNIKSYSTYLIYLVKKDRYMFIHGKAGYEMIKGNINPWD